MMQQPSALPKLTFEDQEVMFVALTEANQFDDVRMTGPTHDLNFLEDVCALRR